MSDFYTSSFLLHILFLFLTPPVSLCLSLALSRSCFLSLHQVYFFYSVIYLYQCQTN